MTPEINGYTIQREIGKGGMGMVYKATRHSDSAEVAIKVLPSHLVNPISARRFQREGRSLMSIDHRNIVKVYDVGGNGGTHYIVMEYVDGRPLSGVLREHGGKIKIAQALDQSRQIASSLEVIHSRQMIHRDLKPANVMVTQEGTVKLLDFGLVQIDGLTMLTATGNVVGTPTYMSPEQCSGTPLDHRSDIYSLGALMYELFTGQPPFKSESIYDLLEMQKKSAPPAPRRLRKEIPQSVEQIVMQCLEKDPQDRPHSVTRVIEVLGGDTAPAEPLLPIRKKVAAGGSQRGRVLLLAGFAALICAAVLGYKHPKGAAIARDVKGFLTTLVERTGHDNGDISDEVNERYAEMAVGQKEYLLGKTHQRESRFSEAFDHYYAAIRANPERHSFYVGLVRVAAAANREAEAVAIIQRYLQTADAEDPGQLLRTWVQGRKDNP